MKLAFRRSTGAVIPDFQSSARGETLEANAIASGVPADDIEIRDVSKEEFVALQDDYCRPVREQEEASRADLDTRAAAVQKRLRLSDDEVRALRHLLSR